MITQYALDDINWTPITTAGQSGTCWLDEDNQGAIGSMDVRVSHGINTIGFTFSKAKRVYKPKSNEDVLIITADSLTDIFYAKCRNGNATIQVDVL